MSADDIHLERAVSLARANIADGGRPFGAVLVGAGGNVLAEAVNTLHLSGDPSDHAELRALRQACADAGTMQFPGAVMYASGQPCPMCLAALAMCGILAVRYACGNDMAEPYGLSTAPVLAYVASAAAGAAPELVWQPIGAAADLYPSWVAVNR